MDKALCEKLSAKEEDFYTCEPFRKTLARIQEIAETGAYGDAVSYTSDAEAKAAFINGDAAGTAFSGAALSLVLMVLILLCMAMTSLADKDDEEGGLVL